MSAIHEVAATATFAHRDQAQSLGAVKLALVNAEARDAGLKARESAAGVEPVGWPFICSYIGLRLADLKSVVEQVEAQAAENFDLQVKMGELLLVSIHRRDLAGRLAAAREEQREACAREVWAKSQCATASELGEISAAIRATPLDATPLADFIATEQAANKLEVEALQAELAAEVARHLVTVAALEKERFAHELEKRERERNWEQRNVARAEVEKLKARLAEAQRDLNYYRTTAPMPRDVDHLEAKLMDAEAQLGAMREALEDMAERIDADERPDERVLATIGRDVRATLASLPAGPRVVR